MSISWLTGIVVSYIVVAGIVVWQVIVHYDKVELVVSRVARLFSWFWTRAERATVAYEIQSRVESLTRELNSEAPGALAHGLKVVWVRQTTREAFIQQGKVVVRLDHHHNQARNLATAIMTFLPEALLPTARQYIHDIPRDGLDLMVARKVLSNCGHEALTYFINEVMEPAIRGTDELRTACVSMESLEAMGLFTRVLIRQYLMLGVQLYPTVATPTVRDETKTLLAFLATLAERPRGVEIPLEFKGRHLSVGFVLVARPEVYAAFGASAYVRRILTLIKQGIRDIYISGWGANISAVHDVVVAIRVSGLEKLDATYFTVQTGGKTIKALLVHFRNNVAVDSAEARKMESRLHAEFIAYLIRDIVQLEAESEGGVIDDLAQIKGLILANPYYDKRTYRRPDGIVQELQQLGILVRRDSGTGPAYSVAGDHQAVRAALRGQS